MSESNIIELKGIVHNTSKIGATDGECEDLLNMRYKDGTWMPTNIGLDMHFNCSEYKQMFVHKCMDYTNLLATREESGTTYLVWVGNIVEGGNKIEYANGTDSIGYRITTVRGESIQLTQTGNIIVIIDDDGIKYAQYSVNIGGYTILKIDANGKEDDTSLFPYGNVHINYQLRNDYVSSGPETSWRDGNDKPYSPSGGTFPIKREEWHSYVLEAYNRAAKKNMLTKPIMAFVAVRLYDGTYAYPSQPVIIFPYRAGALNDYYIDDGGIAEYNNYQRLGTVDGFKFDSNKKIVNVPVTSYVTSDNNNGTKDKEEKVGFIYPSIAPSSLRAGFSYVVAPSIGDVLNKVTNWHSAGNKLVEGQWDMVHLYGYDIVIDISDLSILQNNRDIFTGIAIFATREIDIYDLGEEDYKKGEFNKINQQGIVGLGTPMSDTITENYTDSVGRDADVTYMIYTHCYIPSPRNVEKVTYDLMHSPFYLLKEYGIDDITNKPFIVDLTKEEEGVLFNITQQPTYNGKFSENTISSQKAFIMYNGRLHIANFKETYFNGYPLQQLYSNGRCVSIKNNAIQDKQHETGFKIYSINECIRYELLVSIRNENDCEKQVHRYSEGDALYFEDHIPLLLVYPNRDAKSITIRATFRREAYGEVWYSTTEMTYKFVEHPLYNLAYAITNKRLTVGEGFTERFGEFTIAKHLNSTEYRSNVLKVSDTSNPFIFNPEFTYQIGNDEIRALATNTTALSQGQSGAAPLYVFCSDGVYALMVDSSGEMAYTNSRPISREVISDYNNAIPCDDRVVFKTDRGLMAMVGAEVVELSEAIEGEIDQYYDDRSPEYMKISRNAFKNKQLSFMPDAEIAKANFLDYMKDATIQYNHNERELIVASDKYRYFYAMNRYGQWLRRTGCIGQFLNNYPITYAVNYGMLYRLDEQQNADAKVFMMSRIIKLNSIGFKAALRFIVRGRFKTREAVRYSITDRVVKYYDIPNKDGFNFVEFVFRADQSVNRLMLPVTEENKLPSSECNGKKYKIRVETTDERAFAGLTLKKEDGSYVDDYYPDMAYDSTQRLNAGEMEITLNRFMLAQRQPYYANVVTAYVSDPQKGVTAGNLMTQFNGNITIKNFTIEEILDDEPLHIGLYVFGSYDGIKWACIGYAEKTGEFSDIGCVVSRTDVKYFRVCLAGQLDKSTRIDFMEMSTDNSRLLTGKLR